MISTIVWSLRKIPSYSHEQLYRSDGSWKFLWGYVQHTLYRADRSHANSFALLPAPHLSINLPTTIIRHSINNFQACRCGGCNLQPQPSDHPCTVEPLCKHTCSCCKFHASTVALTYILNLCTVLPRK